MLHIENKYIFDLEVNVSLSVCFDLCNLLFWMKLEFQKIKFYIFPL